MRRLLLAGLTCVVALAGGPSAAHASDISVFHYIPPACTGGDECRYYMEPDYFTFTLTGSPGEVNRITVTGTGAFTDTITFRDDGAPIREAGSCTRVAENEVQCRGRFGHANGGDMNDLITSNGSNVTGNGGPGDDELTGGDSADELRGGPGNDLLRGGGGFDALYDDEPGAAGDADVFDGGAGGARLHYGGSAAPVTVNLGDTAGTHGESGEGDRLSGITAVEGGMGPDNLRAASEGSTLGGGAGDDTLTGGPGDDVIDGAMGANVIDAGDGNDKIGGVIAVRTRNRVACGGGADVVSLPSALDLIGPDCDRLEFYVDPNVAQRLPLSSLNGIVARASDFGCYERGRPNLELRVARTYRTAGLPRSGTLLGRRTATRRVCSGNRTLAVRLSSRGARLLRRHRRLPVEVRVNDPGNEVRYVTELTAP